MTAIKSFPVLGDQVDMLVTSEMTGGASATLLETSPPGGGPPPHKHENEDETFFIVEGEHLVQELQKAAQRDPRLRGSEIYLTRDFAHWSSPLPMHVVQSKQMAQISETRSPQGIAAVVPLLSTPAPEPRRAIYLHEIQDPGNLGTILRTLAWFGGFRCLLSPDSVDVHNGKVVRASMGAIFHVPVEIDVPLDSLPARFPRMTFSLHIAPGSSWVSRFVLAWSARPNEGVRPGLDCIREFLEVLAHVTQVFEQLINVLGVHIQGLIELAGEVGDRREGLAKLDYRLPDVGAVLAHQRIDMA